MSANKRVQSKYFHVARITLESQSAFSINSGLSDAQFDNLVVRDANGLPSIPGTTLAGTLRHLYHDNYPDKEIEVSLDLTQPTEDGKNSKSVAISAADNLFGTQIRDDDTNLSIPSPMQVSWGYLHNSQNKPVDALLSFDAITRDKVLNRLVNEHPAKRDRVRINRKGVADHQGKFDHTVIPAGCRFSAELSLWWGERNPQEWLSLLGVLTHPLLRIGGSTRSGLGQFGITIEKQASFDLSDPDEFAQFATLPPAISMPWSESIDVIDQTVEAPAFDTDRFTKLDIELEAEDFWRFGQGEQPLRSSDSGNNPDAVPVVEDYIHWGNNGPSFESRVVAAGSGIKGALRHRTLFHLYRYLHKESLDISDKHVETVLETLFGCPANQEDPAAPVGQAGRLYIADSTVDITLAKKNVMHMMHNSIDRYTGGVRDKVLYQEELLWKQPLSINILIDKRIASGEKNPEEVNKEVGQLELCVKALQHALDDAGSGRLSFGAAAAKGHGYFQQRSVQTEGVRS